MRMVKLLCLLIIASAFIELKAGIGFQRELDSILMHNEHQFLHENRNNSPGNASKDSIAAKYIKIAYGLYTKGKAASSLLLVNRIIDELSLKTSHRDSMLLAKAYNLNGMNYQELGNLDYALTHYQTASNIAKATNDKKLLASIYNNIFGIYYTRKDYANARDLINLSLEINLAINDSSNIRNNYNNLGLVYYEENDFDTALSHMQKALSYTRTGDMLGKSLILTNIAEVYTKQGSYTKAEQYLDNALGLQKQLTEFNKNTIHTLLNAAYVKAHLGKRAEAEHYQRRALTALTQMSPSPTKIDAYSQLAETEFIMNDSIEGLRYILKHESLADSIDNNDHESQLQQLLVAYDTERLRQNNLNLQQSVKMRTMTIYGSCLFALLLLGFIIFLLHKIKSDKEKNKLINLQREELLHYRQQEHERQQKIMEMQLDHKNRQLTSYTIDLAASNEFYLKIKEKLELARQELENKNDDIAGKLINETVHEILLQRDKHIGDDFRLYFDEVHPDFLNNLSRKYSQLSQNDLRICAYLHLGMTTKEIAALTYREIRSVESTRNRLRKKLNLPGETSLQEFLKAESLDISTKKGQMQ